MVESGIGDHGTIRDAVVVERVGPATAVVQGRRVDAFVFHDYLGLSQRAEIQAAVHRALDDFGLNVCAVRAQGGGTPLHQQLEREIAAFVGKDDAVVFSSGLQATAAALEVLVHRAVEQCLSPQAACICADEAVLPLLLAPAYQLKATVRDFVHNSLGSLRKMMLSRKVEQHVILSYGVYSMHADAAPLDKWLDAAEEHHAFVLMDDAHGIGTIGDHLGGIADHYALAPHPRLIISGSFSKALGGSGGFVAGSHDFCRLVRNSASAAQHSQSIAPCMAAGLLAALNIVREEGLDLRERMRNNITHARNALKHEGLAVQGASAIPCMTLAVGDDATALRIRDDLLREDLLISVVTRPALREGSARLRIMLTACHSRDQLIRLAEALARAAARYRVRLDG